jgi:DNA polymerase-3 subunit epsilon
LSRRLPDRLADLSLAFVDLETSGSTPTKDRITEIGMVLVDGDQVERWSSLVNPHQTIPSFIETLTGISNDMVAQAPSFEELAPEVRRRLQGRLFVAHNARFDYGFLKQSFARAGYSFQATTLCTVKLSRRLFPQEKKHNLDSLVARFGLVQKDRHRALADADLIFQFWQQISTSLPEAALVEAVQELSGHPSLPSGLDPALADELPESCGVYLFWGEDQVPLYVGKSKNIRERVFSHFAADVRSAKELGLSQQVRHLTWEETPGEVSALLREAQLVKTLRPSFNRQLRQQKGFTSIALGPALASPQVQLVSSQDQSFAVSEDLYGIFESMTEARRVLGHLADQHGLCKGQLGLEKLRPGAGCFGRQLKRCRGVCQGQESARDHHLRLSLALSKLKLAAWPFEGPAILRESDEAVLVVDRWAYLGLARSEEELWSLLASEGPAPQFDRDTYRILQKVAHRLTPVVRPGSQADSRAD